MKAKEITLEDLRNAKSFEDIADKISPENWQRLVAEGLKRMAKRATQ